jgi:hypothetical protein
MSMESRGGMILSTTNSTRNNRGANLSLRGERQAINGQSHNTACIAIYTAVALAQEIDSLPLHLE